jgi:hypothetical protein
MSGFSFESPSHYGDRSIIIKVQPDIIFKYGHTEIDRSIESIGASWNAITASWKSLKLQWTGASAEEAQAFADSLNEAQRKMFGLRDDSKGIDEPGLLPLISSAAGQAAVSYGNAEDTVRDMWENLLSSFSGPDPDPNAAPPAPVSENSAPVGITFG